MKVKINDKWYSPQIAQAIGKRIMDYENCSL